jgi:hypothetical protein
VQIAQDVLRGVLDGGLSVTINEARLRELEKSADHLGRDLEHSMKKLEHQLSLEEFGHRMGELGRDIGEAARSATDDMRTIIERAIENGQARPIR